MDCGHESRYDTKLFLQHFRHWSQAVGGTGSAANDGFASIQDFVVGIENDGFEVACGRRRYDNLFCAGSQVSSGFIFIGKKPGTFQHYIYFV